MEITHFTDELIATVYSGTPLTRKERSYLLSILPGFEENTLSRWQLDELTDKELMAHAYMVWSDYAATQ